MKRDLVGPPCLPSRSVTSSIVPVSLTTKSRSFSPGGATTLSGCTKLNPGPPLTANASSAVYPVAIGNWGGSARALVAARGVPTALAAPPTAPNTQGKPAIAIAATNTTGKKQYDLTTAP